MGKERQEAGEQVSESAGRLLLTSESVLSFLGVPIGRETLTIALRFLGHYLPSPELCI